MESKSRHESVRQVLSRSEAGGEVNLQGWVRTARHGKEVSFLELNDGSCLSGLQVVAGPECQGFESDVRTTGTGCAVQVVGELVDSPGKGQRYEVHAHRVVQVGDVEEGYPLQKKRHSFEFLRTIAHLRPRTNTIGAVLRVRDRASRAIHDFFHQEGFVQLHAPLITSSDAEGAGQMFRVTSLDPGEVGRDESGQTDWSGDFFGGPAFLSVSGQLEAEIGAMALSKVYTFGPTFRAENSNTARHLAEFWMVEPEVAFCELDALADLAEQFLRRVFTDVRDDCQEDLAFFDQRIDDTVLSTIDHVIERPFERITYTQGIEILQSSGRDFEFAVEWGSDLQSEHERFLSEEYFKSPLVVTDYPKGIKAFYMYLNDDDRTVAAMDVLVPRIGEIIGGSQREHRLDTLRQRIADHGLPEEEYWWYLDLRRYGSVPHGGFGLGFERLVQFITGMANIRDVIPFPRVPGSAEF